MVWLAGGVYLVEAVGGPPGPDGTLSHAPGDGTKSAGRLAFGAPRTVIDDPNASAFEPSIQVSPDGTVYIAAARGNRETANIKEDMARSYLLQSTDNGQNWNSLRNPPYEAIPALEGDIAVDSHGALYLVDMVYPSPRQGDLLLTRWTPSESGPQWEYSNLVGTATWDDRPWLAAQGSDTLYLLSSNDLPTINMSAGDASAGDLASVFFSRSDDGGKSWRTLYGFPASDHCTLVASPIDTVTVYVACAAYSYVSTTAIPPDDVRVDFYSSHDRGETWTREQVAELASITQGREDGFVSVAVDAAGRPFVAWVDPKRDVTTAERLPEPVPLWLAWPEDDGAWASIELTPFPGTIARPWVAAGRAGTVAVSFYATEQVPPDVTSPWHVYTVVTADATRRNADWQIARLDPVRVDAPWASESPLDFFQSAIGPDNSVHVAYHVEWGDECPNGWGCIRYVHQEAGPNLRGPPVGATGGGRG